MLKNIAGAKITTNIATSGASTVLVAGQPGKAIFVYEIIGAPSLASTVSIKNGAITLDTQILAAGQGVTWSEIAGEDGEPRFQCSPGSDLVMACSAGVFTGGLVYAFRE